MLEVVFQSSQDRLLELAYQLGDCVGIIPIVKTNSVILDEAKQEDFSRVVECIRAHFAEAGQSDFDFALKGNKIFVIATSENSKTWVMSPTGRTRDIPGVFVCPHCGKISTIEAEYKSRLVSHYVIF